ncbi:MAG: transcriptional regulator [Saprospiraceae bacterium]
MKEFDISRINKDFESRVRLGIMSVLMVNDWVNFIEMKKILDLTDGNLSSHSMTLESKNYIEVRKAFVGKKTETSYRISNEGRIAFKQHLKALVEMIN